MPLNSIQQHVQSVLSGLYVPNVTDALTTYITPPVIEGLNGPRCYVWGGTTHETRKSAPRGQGFKKLLWDISVWLIYESQPTVSGIDSNYPVLVDAVMGALRTAPMPVQLTDPQTGQVSQLVAIGEQMTLDYPPERLAASARLMYWASRLTVSVEEAVQG